MHVKLNEHDSAHAYDGFIRHRLNVKYIQAQLPPMCQSNATYIHTCVCVCCASNDFIST